MNRQPARVPLIVPNRMRIVATAVLLCALSLALPVRLQRASQGLSSEECLTLADQPPADGPDVLDALERCSALVPDDIELLADLGARYESTGRPEDAEQIYQRALTIDPEYADLHGRLARLLMRRGAAHEAREHAEMALRIQPNRRALQDILEQTSPVVPEGQP